MSSDIASLAILGLASIVAPLVARRSGIPCVVIEIMLGMLLGKSILGVVDVTSDWIGFLFDFGLIYLLFLAGLEVEMDFLRKGGKDSLIIGTSATLVPFALGYLLGLALNVSPELVGVISSTTSVGIVLPTITEMKLNSGSDSFYKLTIGATAVSDMLSMFILAMVIQETSPNTDTLIMAAVALALIYPSYKAVKLYSRVVHKISDMEERYHFSTRLSMVLMVVFTYLAESVGIHGVVGAFFAGIIISELIESVDYLLKNLASFGYALFIPMFFLITGSKIDLMAIFSGGNALLIVGLILISLVGKVAGVYFSAKGRGLNGRKAFSMGIIMWAKLSLVIAAAEAGLRIGLIDIGIYSTIVVYALITVFLSPSLFKWYVSRG